MVRDVDGVWIPKSQADQKWADDLVRGFVCNPLRGTVLFLIGVGGVVAFNDYVQRTQQRSERNSRRTERRQWARLMEELERLAKG
jgi:hypothetical protein